MWPPTTMAVAHWRIGCFLADHDLGDAVDQLGELLVEFGDVGLLGAVIMDESTTGWDCLTGLYRLAGLHGTGCDCW